MSQTELAPDLNQEIEPLVFNGVETDYDIRVLLVDDDGDLLDLTSTFLQREREEFEVTSETDVDLAAKRIRDEDFDVVVSDYDMPKMTGLEFLEQVREQQPDLPFILFTGKGSEDIASEAISKGVTDYLQKKTGSSQYSILANRIINAVEQYRATSKLRRSQEKFSKLVKNSTDLITIVDENGQFQYVSPASEHVTGFSQEELVGQSAFKYMQPDDRQMAMEAFFEAIENPELDPIIEFRFQKPDGDGWTIIEARGNNLFDDDFINGFVVTARDITHLKEREQELEQQNEQLKNMRKVITHDLRNPLSVAANALVLYQETNDSKHLGKVEKSLNRIENLIDQVVALADNTTKIGETKRVSLKSVARDAWEMVETGESELHLYDSNEFKADPGRFQQLLENLIRNAIDHNEGPVTVTIGTHEGGIYVEDDGKGIPPDEREQIFESGYSTAAEHTGFGLSIVKQIAVGHGWELDVTDSADGGARFEITGVTFEPSVYN